MDASDVIVIKQHLIDPEICIRCNTCEETCPVDAVTHDDNNYVVDAEKCNFCLQRIVSGEDKAASEGRSVMDGEVKTACMQVCPTNAITFGRLDDPESEVSKLSRNARGFTLLEELGTEPAVTYLKGGSTHG